MNFLPVVQRELQVRCRQPVTYRLRMFAALAGLILLTYMSWQMRRVTAGASAGQFVFQFLSSLAMLYCLFEGARTTADCISEEKREGTLGLLFLTDLTGRDVVFGKLAATSLNSFYGLLAVFPALAIPLLMGGVTGGEFWRVVLVLANTLLLSLSLGIWVSVRNREAERTAKTTICLLIVVAALPVVVDEVLSVAGASTAMFSIFSPGFANYMARDAYYKASPPRFWLSVGMNHLTSWVLLAIAGRELLAKWRQTGDEERKPAWLRRLQTGFGRFTTVVSPNLGRLDRNPFHWFAEHSSRPEVILWIVGGLSALGLSWQWFWPPPAGAAAAGGYYFTFSWIAAWIIKMLAASRASRSFLESRESGAMEILLCSPLPPSEIIQGQRLALRRFFFWAVVIAASLNAGSALSQVNRLLAPPGATSNVTPYFTFNAVANTFVFAADIWALSWVAMWFALYVRGQTQVVARAFLYVVIIPWILTIFVFIRGISISGNGIQWLSWGMMPAILIVKDMLFVAWAKRKLRKEFRSVVVEGPRSRKPEDFAAPYSLLSEQAAVSSK